MPDSSRPTLPEIPAEAHTPLVDALLELLAWQARRLSELEDEIHRLKNETRKPPPPPSHMDKQCDASDSSNQGKPRSKPGPKRRKTAHLVIHEERVVAPIDLPDNCRFKGYRDVVVQDLQIRCHNTRFRLEQYETPEGRYLSGRLPEGISAGHWGSTLHSFILYQYHHQHVTQPLLLEQLHSHGIDISSGQLSRLLTEGERLGVFHQEKASLLSAGLAVSSYIHADDTGARHQGERGYCTHIGNELFAWFASTESKSRVNFLTLLGQGEQQRYVLNAGAIDYMAQHKLPKRLITLLETAEQPGGLSTTTWEAWLDSLGITGKRHRRITTEGALMGGLLQQGIPTHMAVISDDAGQFNVFDHALCWIHAERLVNRLIPSNDVQRKAVNWAQECIWTLYADLKRYKQAPSPEQADEIRAYFDEFFQTRTDYATLNAQLGRLAKNRDELLRVLDRPELPLHNNLSERDIRDYVKKRKISGSTRSEAGRRCRDTFASLKKTCRKHDIRFWDYLVDRLSGSDNIPSLGETIRKAAATCH